MGGCGNKESVSSFYPDYPEMRPLTAAQLEAELDRGRVYRLNDRFFKFLFGGEERKPLFLDLVNVMAFPDGSQRFSGFEYANREFSSTRREGKLCYLDVVAYMADGTQLEVEVQVKNRMDYLQRSTYYLSALHTSQMNVGESYRNLKKTWSIHILGFDLFEDGRFRRAFSLCDEETGAMLYDNLRLIYLEIPKYARHGTPRNRLEYWLGYLAGMEAEKMPETMTKDPMIGQALELEKLFLQSREERQNYILSYKAMRDAMTFDAINRYAGKVEGLAEGEAKGKAEGEAKGRAEGLAEAARRMRDMGLTPEQIAQATGLSFDAIEALG